MKIAREAETHSENLGSKLWWNHEARRLLLTLAKTITYTLNHGMKHLVSFTSQIVMTYTGNTMGVFSGKQKEMFGKSGWEKHDRDQQKLGKLEHWGLKVLLARVSGFSRPYGILSCEQGVCGSLGHHSLFRTPCGPVSLPPVLCKAPGPCV